MYELADGEVESLANEIIDKHHRHLLKAHITYLFRDRPWKTSESRTILGRASKRNEIDKLLSPKKEDFIILLARPTWDKADLEHKKFLLDHELSHCGVMVSTDGDSKWILRRHVIEEFPENLARFEFRRKELGDLIEKPPSAIVSKPAVQRHLTPEE